MPKITNHLAILLLWGFDKTNPKREGARIVKKTKEQYKEKVLHYKASWAII
jgi:hypothetical protein